MLLHLLVQSIFCLGCLCGGTESHSSNSVICVFCFPHSAWTLDGLSCPPSGKRFHSVAKCHQFDGPLSLFCFNMVKIRLRFVQYATHHHGRLDGCQTWVPASVFLIRFTFLELLPRPYDVFFGKGSIKNHLVAVTYEIAWVISSSHVVDEFPNLRLTLWTFLNSRSIHTTITFGCAVMLTIFRTIL